MEEYQTIMGGFHQQETDEEKYQKLKKTLSTLKEGEPDGTFKV